MSAMTDYLENKIIDHIFRNTSYTIPSTIYVGLFTAAPSDTGGGTEVSGGSYARVQVGPSVATWKSTNGTSSGVSSGTGGVTMNVGAVTFPAPSGAWGLITHFGIFDAITTGNLLFWGALGASKTVNASDPAPSFAADALTITLA